MFFDITLPAMRRKQGKAFRKRLGVYSYKHKKIGYHKLPGVIPLHVKEDLKKKGTDRAMKLIKKLERESNYPFGKHSKKGTFRFDPSRVPFYDVPDLTDFKLRPYVSVHTPLVDEEVKKNMLALNDFLDPRNFGRFTVLATENSATEAAKGEKQVEEAIIEEAPPKK